MIENELPFNLSTIPAMLGLDEYPPAEACIYVPPAKVSKNDFLMRVEAREFTLLHAFYAEFWSYLRCGQQSDGQQLKKAFARLNSFYNAENKFAPGKPKPTKVPKKRGRPSKRAFGEGLQ